MTEPMSQSFFMWFITFAVGGLGALWFVYDGVNLMRALELDRHDPSVRDRQFGYAMGMAMGTIGVIGALKFHGVV
jgi:hypothetical protein